MDWDWFSSNIENILKNFVDYILGIINLVVTGLFNALDSLVALLPAGSTVLTTFTLPTDSYGIINSLNYFFDITRIAGSIAAALTLHLSLMVGIAALRFFQVMK